MIGLIFTGIIFFIVGVALIIADDHLHKNFVALVLLAIAFICFHEYGLKTNPQAIDVYRGKTTLEITYKDSIPVDSVVVFKE